ncbi:MAG: zinc-ribbon domain-containing protein [Methanoregula sp.]|nr:zinc-ribbon domain-containing protein [Methanoregula sp.]
MKCPHCGIEVRDNTVECGYCGNKITRREEKKGVSSGRADLSADPTKAGTARISGDELEGEEEEEGGLSKILQPGEQVLIGSLNISVKKFFFHAYLTNQRIFLIDTQEKKLKVTAKDIQRDTIVGSIIEFSENSDPVLVLSIRSTDDEIKTMKIVFAQNGMDRSAEIDEWVALLNEEKRPKKGQKRRVEEPEEEKPEPEEVLEFVKPAVSRPERAVQNQELHPARKPSKDHEKQPPVKRLVTPYTVPRQRVEMERQPPVEEPVRRAQIRQVPEPAKRPVANQEYDRETEVSREAEEPPVRKHEAPSAMKVAMKGAMQPIRQSPMQQSKRPVEPVRRQVIETVAEPEPEPERVPVRRSFVQEKPAVPAYERQAERTYTHAEREEPEETGTPQFCHHCGKKLPHAANFCPGCGTRLGQNKTPAPAPASHHPAQAHHEKRVAPRADIEEEELEAEKPVPTKPPVKKVAPKGSEMTILHKFLRR